MLSKKIIIMPIKIQNIVIIPHILKCFVEFIIVLRFLFLFLCFWDISATIIFAADPESVKFPATKKRKKKKEKKEIKKMNIIY